MKANELMIGDLIYRQQNDVSGNVEPYSIIYLDIARLAKNENDFFSYFPIPLTEEIFKANGFDRVMFEDGNPTDEWFYVSTKKYFRCHFHEQHKYWWISTPDAYIHFYYVHEFQHALRLCGLDELADNFKIK